MIVALSQGTTLNLGHNDKSVDIILEDFVHQSTLWTEKESKLQNIIWEYGQQEQNLQKQYIQGKISNDYFRNKICKLAKKCQNKLDKAYVNHKNKDWFENLNLASKIDFTASTTICDHLNEKFECNGWFFGELGESCDEVCAKTGKPCDVDRLNAVTTAEAMEFVVAASSENYGEEITCPDGIALGGLSYDPSLEFGTCYYIDNDSSQCNTTGPANRFCCCSDNGVADCPVEN